MEFLRFGSSIPGSYWGCCACDIIQDLNQDPDSPASIQLVEGDGGTTLGKFAGKTYRDIFLQRLHYGTFSADQARATNHAFIIIMSKSQVDTVIGKKWLALMKANGFEFVRSVNNSVWNKVNYIFMLVRNVGNNAVSNQFHPPSAWTSLPDVVPEVYKTVNGTALTAEIKTAVKPLYDALPQGVFYTEAELEAEGVPITYAGKRSHQHGQPSIGYPQQLKADRERFKTALEKPKEDKASAFPVKAPLPPIPSVG